MAEDGINTNIKNVSRSVWDVYDEYRTARLNVYYYEKRHSVLKLWNFLIELFIALSVPSVAGLWLWDTDVGNIIWKVIAVMSAILAVVKPLVGLSNQIQQNGETLTQWRLLHSEFQKLVMSISQYTIYDNKMREQFLKILETKTQIKEPPESSDFSIKKKCRQRVNIELPLKNFYVPEEKGNVTR